MSELKPTGFCFNCGRQCPDLFCVSKNDTCRKKYKRSHRVKEKEKSYE